MPANFDKCIAAKGSKKVTKTLPGNKYVHGCSYNGKDWIWGEVKEKEMPNSGLLSKRQGE